MAEVHTVKCDVCSVQKKEENGWFVVDNEGDGLSIHTAPANVEEIIEYDYHLCGVDCVLKKAGQLLVKESNNVQVLES